MTDDNVVTSFPHFLISLPGRPVNDLPVTVNYRHQSPVMPRVTPAGQGTESRNLFPPALPEYPAGRARLVPVCGAAGHQRPANGRAGCGNAGL